MEAYQLFGVSLRRFINSNELTIRPLTDTVSRSTDGLDMQMKKNIANLVLDNYFYHLLLLLKITLKSLVEKKICCYGLLVQSTILSWNFLTFDVQYRYMKLNVEA
jgi:hypothetical protein